MGYSTDFVGTLKTDKPLTLVHATYLRHFSASRRMKRDVVKSTLLPDPHRISVGLPSGVEACFFVGDDLSGCGHRQDASIVDHNKPPKGQPGSWCDWTVNDQGELEWNGSEKFSCYIQWLQYLIDNFYEPWGYKLNGSINWQGEDDNDAGTITVVNNVVTTQSEDVDETIRLALRVALAEIQEHNSEYKHVTSEKVIAEIRKAIQLAEKK